MSHVVESNDIVTATKGVPTPPATLQPSLPETVQVGLTSCYITIFGILFLGAYVQLWMIWYYRHKRLSHQTLFLYQCLIWSGLRTFLFSLYYKECSTPNTDIALYCLLYVFPVCIQFSMLCLLLHYFAQVVLKTRTKYEPRQYKLPLRIFLSLSVMIFIAMNMVFAVETKHYENTIMSVPKFFLYLRVALTETMFLIYGILFSICIYKMSTVAASRRALEAKGMSVSRAVIASILIALLFLSRTVYNLITILEREKRKNPDFGYDWINVSDQADDMSHLSGGLAYVSFGIVLFVWEVLPVTIVLIFFRVRRLQAGQVMTDFSAQNNGSRVFFFDNPRRYDSVDDLASHDANDPHHDTNSIRSNQGENWRPSYPGSRSINASLAGSYTSAQQYLGVSPRSSDSQKLFTPSARGYGSIINNMPPPQSSNYNH